MIFSVHRHFTLAAIILLSQAALVVAEDVKFSRDIRPLLSDTCFRCHGPDASARQAELRLDVGAAAQADRGGYAAIVPGKPAASEAMRRILSDDPDQIMPPRKSGLRLSTKQKDLLRRWIAEGAKYETHWAFTQITRPCRRSSG